jgi:ferric-dicitrate binding protein FerR (iron transport regulator)
VTTRERFEALQSRWAAGETLDATEERERVESAVGDALAERELALFAALRERGQGAEELPKGFVERVLEAIGSRPRLHLLAPGERPPLPPRSNALRRGVLMAAAVLAAGAVASAFVAFRSQPANPTARPAAPTAASPLARSELVFASGDVTPPRDAGVGGRPLAEGDRLTTNDGRACLGIDPGIDVCLGGHTEIVVESLRSDDVRVHVEHGTALAALTKREPGQSFSLTAGNVSATAHGTVFAVERRAGEPPDVVVMEGAVEVGEKAGAGTLVPAHARLRVGTTRRAPEAVGRGEEARLWAVLAPRELWAKPELGVLEVGAAEPGSEVALDDGPPLALPFRAFVPAGRRSLAFRSAGGREAQVTVDIVAGETSVFNPNELSLRPTASQNPLLVPSAEALLARARKELAAGNTRVALAAYQELRFNYPKSPEARTVLVTIGKLELDMQQPASALATFDAYLAAPGPLAPEALAGKIRALRALGRTSDERRAIQTYLSRYPDGFEAPLLEQRLQVLQGR